MWGEPISGGTNKNEKRISTHSPRVGRTDVEVHVPPTEPNFNSLAPCGANLNCPCTACGYNEFQLTRPVWGEPGGVHVQHDLKKDFNSLAPCGANHERVAFQVLIIIFQLTRPVWGEPAEPRAAEPADENFNSLAPCGANLYILYICRLFAATWGGQ